MNPFEMMKNLPGINQKAQEMQEKMKAISVTGSSGADMVQVTMNGNMEVTEVKIDPVIFKPEQAQTVEVLLASAVNSAISEVKAKSMELARSSLKGIPIPGMFS